MMSLKKTIKDIKDIKIQGAENVAIAAAKAIRDIAVASRQESYNALSNELHDARIALVSSRPTEPCLRNTVKYIFSNLHKDSQRMLKEDMIRNSNLALKHFRDTKDEISKTGALKIPHGGVVFTHCHSSTVIDILKAAKAKGKRFEVYNTETRPRFQGRKTAKDLSDAGIKVTHFVDSAAKLAIKKADIMLIGADAVTSEGEVINKIGSELFAIAAEKYSVPVYSCTDSWKFDPESCFGFVETIEERKPVEVWPDPPKNVRIHNYAFEIVHPGLMSGIITELGVYKPEVIVEEIKRNYPWMFRRI